MTVNNGNVSITEDSLISSEDYSDMLVNVIKREMVNNLQYTAEN